MREENKIYGLSIEEAFEKANNENPQMPLELIMGDDFTLTIDIDNNNDVDKFLENLAILKKVESIVEADTWKSRSQLGSHFLLRTKNPHKAQERAGIQAFLGSDPKREVLGYVNAFNWPDREPFCLFKPKW